MHLTDTSVFICVCNLDSMRSGAAWTHTHTPCERELTNGPACAASVRSEGQSCPPAKTSTLRPPCADGQKANPLRPIGHSPACWPFALTRAKWSSQKSSVMVHRRLHTHLLWVEQLCSVNIQYKQEGRHYVTHHTGPDKEQTPSSDTPGEPHWSVFGSSSICTSEGTAPGSAA